MCPRDMDLIECLEAPEKIVSKIDAEGICYEILHYNLKEMKVV